MESKIKGIRSFGYTIGGLPIGERNSITDIPGVRVGQTTICTEGDAEGNGTHHTGVTVILPVEDNIFLSKVTGAAYVLNGYGKTAGLVQVEELGTIETPIALTNTLNVGKVMDALVEYSIESCRRDGYLVASVNAVVGETNDSQINDIRERIVDEKAVMDAIRHASRDVEQGCVGAGAGTTCFGLKGGIGTSSRLVKIGGETYTIGALVQSNFGATKNLRINGDPIGERIAEKIREAENDKGSIMMVIGTDAPLSDRQLKRVLKRAAVGLSRCGSFMGHGSGDIVIGFSTGNRFPQRASQTVQTIRQLSEDRMDHLFTGAAEALEEAILNSLACAHAEKALDGRVFHALSEFL